MMKKYLLIPLLLFSFFIISSCSTNNEKTYKFKPRYRPNIVLDDNFDKDVKGLDILASQFSHNIDVLWGVNELLVASKKDYVKYTDNFYTRSHISFEEGMVSIESIVDDNVKIRLKNSIIHTLLMGGEPDGIDLFASGDVPISDNPFLLGQILNNKNQPIKDFRSAELFADELITTNLKISNLSNGKQVAKILIPMVASHIEIRARKYVPMVRKYARKYKIDESLILAIMKVESSFNPYAISYANAVGLMQIVPSSAGRDIFKKVKNLSGKPSQSYLFNPDHNIDAGVAYLSLLKNEYLDGIKDPIALKYMMIASYNAGPGESLGVFDYDRQTAIKKINKSLSEQVYKALSNRHPSAQTRNYVKKVTAAEKQIRKY